MVSYLGPVILPKKEVCLQIVHVVLYSPTMNLTVAVIATRPSYTPSVAVLRRHLRPCPESSSWSLRHAVYIFKSWQMRLILWTFGQTGRALTCRSFLVVGPETPTLKWRLFPRLRRFGGMFDHSFCFVVVVCLFVFEVDVGSRTPIPLFRPGSVHSGSAASLKYYCYVWHSRATARIGMHTIWCLVASNWSK